MCFSLIQIYRSGIIESADRDMFETHDKLLITGDLLDGLRTTISDTVAFLERSGVADPVAILFTLYGVKGYRLAHRGNARVNLPAFDRAVVSLPTIVLADLRHDILDLLVPMLDALWNAAGYPKFSQYAEFRERWPRRSNSD